MSKRLVVLLVGASVCALTLVFSGVVLADDEPYCEFPAQSVQLQRSVNITNTTLRIVDVETDVCGNVVGYTEQMTRTLPAGPWVPASVNESF